MKRVDVAILGGGCAGVSLIAALRRQSRGADLPSLCVLESAEAFATNKTWGFWHPMDSPPEVPISSSFAEWRFSIKGGEAIQHRSERWRYSVVEGARFFGEAEQARRGDPDVEWRMGCPVLEVREEGEVVRVVTGQGDYLCRYVVDTRSPARACVEQSRLFQVFLGAELSIPEGVGHATLALMENMESDSRGFRFDYVVPLGGDRILVEATRFSVNPLGAEALEDDLQASLKRSVPDGRYRVVRKEYGMIPMGLPVERGNPAARCVQAGARGGAVRASSGYAFAEIQEWAQRCAGQILAGKPPVGHPGRSQLLARMDALFIEVLRAEPERAPDFFWRIARNVPVDSFVRFMMGTAPCADLLKVIRSLPPWPFLRQLCRT